MAIVLIALSTLNIATLPVAREAEPQELVVRALRLGLTCALAYQLAKGRSWARWLTAVLTGLAALMSLAAIFLVDMPSSHLRWGAVTGVAYAAVSGFLIFSKRVAAECAPAP